ncbi:MAG: deaminase [bacterium]|nr:deaminase [bacterium]
MEKVLVIHIPVIHKGYLDFLTKNRENVSHVYILGNDLLNELTEFRPDIVSVDTETAKTLLQSFGFQNVSILTKENMGDVKGKILVLVQDEVSRNLYEKYLKDQSVEWASVFLRWDKSAVEAIVPLEGVEVSKEPFDLEMLDEAFQEAQKSGDWWRQVGAVLVKDGKVVMRAHNQGMPSDHTPYQAGMVRDLYKAGEKQELSNTIHAEPRLIGNAAKEGIALKGASLYVTHFPCAVCAKTVACSGISRLYFREGASTLDGKIVLESAGITLVYIPEK